MKLFSFQIKDDILCYTQSLVPMISLASLILFLCLFSMGILFLDLFEKGCLAWHRDSLGLLIQKTIFAICFLVTSVYLQDYIYLRENFEPQGNLIPR